MFKCANTSALRAQNLLTHYVDESAFPLNGFINAFNKVFYNANDTNTIIFLWYFSFIAHNIIIIICQKPCPRRMQAA